MRGLGTAVGFAVLAGGCVEAVTVDGRGNYRARGVALDTPLPEGYPAPTPPGAIDLKTYPSVRRAEVSYTTPVSSGMNRAFWDLFDHIKKHEIAMTTPVEMDYRDLESSSQEASPRDWTMAFLYRTPELNETGVEENVVVRDAAPVTVVSAGVRGDYGMETVRRGMERVEEWLGANGEWEAAGNWRVLNYNGPKIRWWTKWAEVQIPVRKRGSDAE